MTDFGHRPLTSIPGDQETVTLVDAVVFDSAAETYTATGVDASKYRKFLLLIDLAVTGSPTDIEIQVRFSDDDTTYYHYTKGPFGDLRYEDTAGDKTESLPGHCIADYMDVHVISSGCDSSNKFTLTIKAILTN